MGRETGHVSKSENSLSDEAQKENQTKHKEKIRKHEKKYRTNKTKQKTKKKKTKKKSQRIISSPRIQPENDIILPGGRGKKDKTGRKVLSRKKTPLLIIFPQGGREHEPRERESRRPTTTIMGRRGRDAPKKRQTTGRTDGRRRRGEDGGVMVKRWEKEGMGS